MKAVMNDTRQFLFDCAFFNLLFFDNKHHYSNLLTEQILNSYSLLYKITSCHF